MCRSVNNDVIWICQFWCSTRVNNSQKRIKYLMTTVLKALTLWQTIGVVITTRMQLTREGSNDYRLTLLDLPFLQLFVSVHAEEKFKNKFVQMPAQWFNAFMMWFPWLPWRLSGANNFHPSLQLITSNSPIISWINFRLKWFKVCISLSFFSCLYSH